MNKVILISGKAESGKDSVAELLKEKLPGRSLIIHNADYLKYVARQYLGWDGQKNEKGRAVLQFLGTDRVRIGLNKPLFWIEKTCDVIEILLDEYDYFLVADCRFVNECHLPAARFPNKTITLKVERLNHQNRLTEEQRRHPSETSLDNYHFDYIIQSESGLDNLSVEVDKFINFLGGVSE